MIRIAIPLIFSLLFASCLGHSVHSHDHGHEGHNHAAEAPHEHDGHKHDHHEHEGHNHAAEAPHEHDGHKHDHDGHDKQVDHTEHKHAPGVIELHDEIADRFGVTVAPLTPTPFAAAVRAAGTVQSAPTADAVISAPTTGIITFANGIEAGRQIAKGSTIASIDGAAVSGGNQGAAAKAALDAARTEYERIEALYADQLATIAERNAALAALRQAEAAYSPAAVVGSATSPISGTITSLAVRQGQYVTAGDIIASVNSATELTVRIDLPQRYASQAATFTDAVIDLPYGNGSLRLSDHGGKRISGTALPAQNATAFVPVYFTIGNGTALTPGTTFTAHLIGNSVANVITVPVNALSEQQGEFFVYEYLGDEHYTKRRVNIIATDGIRAHISGIAQGTPVVVEGTTTVRLAENGANIPEGHSHNH